MNFWDENFRHKKQVVNMVIHAKNFCVANSFLWVILGWEISNTWGKAKLYKDYHCILVEFLLWYMFDERQYFFTILSQLFFFLHSFPSI